MNAWKESQAVHEIAINEEVRRAIAQLHGGRVAWPIQTKNWLIGSMTPAHADIIFYDTLPRRGLLVGTWVALEDTSMPRRGHSSCGPRAIKRACGIWKQSASRRMLPRARQAATPLTTPPLIPMRAPGPSAQRTPATRLRCTASSNRRIFPHHSAHAHPQRDDAGVGGKHHPWRR